MKILVTGGAGFIGSHFIRFLQKKEVEIVNLDLLTYAGNRENLMKDIPFVCGDIADEALVNDLFEKERFDAVVNFAAETHVDRSIADSTRFIHSNVEGVRVLLEACCRYQVHFHQISTDEVYGSVEEKVDESHCLMPSNPYSASKASADLLVLAYYKTYGLKVTISRCTNNYGSHQYPEKLIPLMIQKAIFNEKLPVYGNGLQQRDWIYVEDHCQAVWEILRHGRFGEIYHVGANCVKSNLEIIRMILKQTNQTEDLIEHVCDRLGHDVCYALNTDKIEKELHWKPKMMFEEGMTQTIDWYIRYFQKEMK